MVYNDGSRQWLDDVITHELTHVFQFHILPLGLLALGADTQIVRLPALDDGGHGGVQRLGLGRHLLRGDGARRRHLRRAHPPLEAGAFQPPEASTRSASPTRAANR